MKYLREHEKLFIVFGIVACLFLNIFLLSLYLMPKSLANAPVELDEPSEIVETIIYREKAIVSSMLSQFQEEVIANDLFPCDITYLTEKDGTYYLGIYQDIILFITPLEMNDVNSDIVYQMGIMITSDSNNYELAQEYFKLIVKVNNEFIWDIESFVEKIVNLDGETLDENNGLLGIFLKNEEEINFVIERKYEMI